MDCARATMGQGNQSQGSMLGGRSFSSWRCFVGGFFFLAGRCVADEWNDLFRIFFPLLFFSFLLPHLFLGGFVRKEGIVDKFTRGIELKKNLVSAFPNRMHGPYRPCMRLASACISVSVY